MSLPRASVVSESPSGSWKVYVQPFGGRRRDLTVFRGAPTQIASLSTKDPFGPAAASVTFPAVTLLDAPGTGDLMWCMPEANIDVVWVSADPDADGEPVFTWEGYIVSFEYGSNGLTLACTGAMMQQDNYLAKPRYLYQPLPYEIAIALQFEDKPGLRLAPLRGFHYGKAIAIADFDPGPTSKADAADPKWAGNTGQGPLAWPSKGDPPYRVVQTAEPHGLLEKDTVRIGSSSVKKGSGKRNNGIFGVLRVLSDTDFLVRMPTGATTFVSHGGNLVKPGHLRFRRSSMFPPWWDKKFDTTKYPASKPYLLPTGVGHGDLWSAMLTRDTGKFEPALSNYVQGMLSNMHTSRGQFTLLLDPGRQPYLTHRDHLHAPGSTTLVVDLLWPGVAFGSLSRDFSQRIGVVYAQGRATNGDVYTGMQVTADGSSTWYVPAASRRQVDPEFNNPWLDLTKMRKEVMVSYSDGLDEQEAIRASRDHLQRFSDPGLTGTLQLSSDPLRNGEPFPRQAIQAGMSVQVRGLFGRPDGVLFHITEQSIDAESKVSLTLDSLYRDHLTVDQVRKRGHDSLVPYRMLSTAGTYDPKIPDLLYPWSYKNGAGCIPFGAKELFTKKGPEAFPRGSVSGMFDIPFPWTEYTTKFPPSAKPEYYIKCDVADMTNADKNWANANRALKNFKAYTMHLAAAGEIKLLQIAAYNADGTVKRVPFHVSIWYVSGITPMHMPKLPGIKLVTVAKNASARTTNGTKNLVVVNLPKGHGLGVADRFTLATPSGSTQVDGDYVATSATATTVSAQLTKNATSTSSYKTKVVHWTISDPDPRTSYSVGQAYPFFPQAWEKILPDGRTPTNLTQVLPASMHPPMVGYGNYYEKAGFWPGSSGDGDGATGLLSDEGGFSFDFRQPDLGLGGIDVKKDAAYNQKSPNRVTAYVMIFCDADTAHSTYFLGRAFRKEYLPS
jgi:hypothetical protein